MNLGTLNRLVELRRERAHGTDGHGQPILSDKYKSIRTFWAAKIYKTEDERVAASVTYSVRVVTFRAHWFDGLLQTDRLRCDGETFSVIGFRELGYRAGIEITARAVH